MNLKGLSLKKKGLNSFQFQTDFRANFSIANTHDSLWKGTFSRTDFFKLQKKSKIQSF